MNCRLRLVGVHVQEREVALAQRDEVALGAQVVLDRDGLAVARDVERELGLARRPGSRPRSARPAGRRRRRSRTGAGSACERTVPSTVRSSASVCGLAVDREVGEHAVGARVAQRHRDRPGAVAALGRVQVLEAGHVAAHDDEVHALGVLDVEVAHGLPAAVDDPERELERARPAARVVRASSSVRPLSLTARPRTAAAPSSRRRRGRRPRRPSRPCRLGARPRRLPGWTSMRLPANAAPPKTSASTTAKPASLERVHAATARWATMSSHARCCARRV